MSFLQAILLAIIEGITEFLPISSTGHMVLMSSFLGIEKDKFTKLFEIFFAVLGDQTSNTVKSHILDIMISCVEETEEFSETFLDIILKYLASPHKKDNPEAYLIVHTMVYDLK